MGASPPAAARAFAQATQVVRLSFLILQPAQGKSKIMRNRFAVIFRIAQVGRQKWLKRPRPK